MKLACIVLAHRRPQQLVALLSALQHPSVRIYLHIDRRKPVGLFTRVLEEARLREIALLPRYVSRWGSAEIVDATLAGIAAGVADGCDYFVLISGEDFPLKPLEEIIGFFDAASSASYMHHFPASETSAAPGGQLWDPRYRTEFYTYTVRGRREVCIPWGEDLSHLNRNGRMLNELLRIRSTVKPPRQHPSYAQPVLGSQWWNLSRPAAQYVLRFVSEHPDFRRYHAHTMSPDELFFQSILLGTDFARTHEVINDALRFIRWERSTRPVTLTEDYLPVMLSSGKIFARKFDAGVDGRVIALLAERIRA